MHTYNLKLTGKLNIPEELPIGKDFHVALIGSITSITKKNNEDGSFTFDHKFEPFTLEILRENGTTIKADKTKLSQKLRSRAFIHEQQYQSENMYEWFTKKAIVHFDEIVEYVKKIEESSRI